jgi:hypothetical protein
MFIAAAAFCAMIDQTVDLDNCAFFEDTFGPYETQEECEIRAEEMERAIGDNPLLVNALRMHLQANRVAGVGYCYEETPPGELL